MNTTLVNEGVAIIAISSFMIGGMLVASELVIDWSVSDVRYGERLRRVAWHLFTVFFVTYMLISGVGVLLGFVAALCGVMGVHS